MEARGVSKQWGWGVGIGIGQGSNNTNMNSSGGKGGGNSNNANHQIFTVEKKSGVKLCWAGRIRRTYCIGIPQ
jgi:hypothetical protein